ncbi:MAG: hypothetical protein R3223_00875 [Longimicrobiales bacterium]|nr:hypothetical protein [Longimicrobiales bacterium]
MRGIGWGRLLRIGLFVGLGLNLTGWLGNNLLLESRCWAPDSVGGR